MNKKLRATMLEKDTNLILEADEKDENNTPFLPRLRATEQSSYVQKGHIGNS